MKKFVTSANGYHETWCEDHAIGHWADLTNSSLFSFFTRGPLLGTYEFVFPFLWKCSTLLFSLLFSFLSLSRAFAFFNRQSLLWNLSLCEEILAFSSNSTFPLILLKKIWCFLFQPCPGWYLFHCFFFCMVSYVYIENWHDSLIISWTYDADLL